MNFKNWNIVKYNKEDFPIESMKKALWDIFKNQLTKPMKKEIKLEGEYVILSRCVGEFDTEVTQSKVATVGDTISKDNYGVEPQYLVTRVENGILYGHQINMYR